MSISVPTMMMYVEVTRTGCSLIASKKHHLKRLRSFKREGTAFITFLEEKATRSHVIDGKYQTYFDDGSV